MFYTYVLQQSKKNKEIYIGFTSDLMRRIEEHNHGLNFSTKDQKFNSQNFTTG